MITSEFPAIQDLINAYIDRINDSQGVDDIGVVIGAVLDILGVQKSGLSFSNTTMISQQPDSTIEVSVDGGQQFEIGSVSKVFTTGMFWAKYGPDGFSKTLGELLNNSVFTMTDEVKSITAQELAGYMSGLPQDNGNASCPAHPSLHRDTLKLLFGDLLNTFNPSTVDDSALWPPSEKRIYTYSNLGFSLLGMPAATIKKLDDDDYAIRFGDALQSYCWHNFNVDPPTEPWKTTNYWCMEGTGNSQQRWVPALPIGYNLGKGTNKGKYMRSDPPWAPVPIPEAGSGAIVSNGNDMLKFLTYCMGPNYQYWMSEYLWEHTAWCTGKPQTTGYGWFIKSDDEGGYKYVCKDGGVNGFTAWIGFQQRDPAGANSQRGVFVLTNGPAAVELGQDALASLFKMTGTEPPASLRRPAEPAHEARVH